MTMQRREFLTAGVAVAAAGALSVDGIAQQTATGEDYSVGNFILRRIGTSLQVLHKNKSGRILWETVTDGTFITAETAQPDIKDFGTPMGFFSITDSVSASYENPTIDKIEVAGAASATVSGKLTGPAGVVQYELRFEPLSTTGLRFIVSVDRSNASSINRITLQVASIAEEGVFGFGEQLTYFNQKGHILPIVVQEHGVGRGRPIVTQLVDLFARQGAGDPYITEAPAPHFMTSRLRSMFLENTEYSTFDMRPFDRVVIKVWSPAMTGRILYGETPLDLIESYTEYSGRMRPLPDWVHSGVILGVVGGTAAVRAKLDNARKADIPVAGLWIQDWVGIRITPVGTQLWWNWQLDETYYAGWKELVADVESQGGRMLIYINPFLSTETGHDSLFIEAKAKGYLVENADGTPFLNKNSNFYAALIDLSNPQTRTWIKDVIKTEMIGKAGASGWMNDFGEALPFDGRIHEGDPGAWHNRYPEEWARVAREAIEESGRGDDIVFFDRSGFARSPGYATLFWLGDQLQSWDEYSGIKSALVGLLSGGISGFSLVHSDTGGYDSFEFKLRGEEIPVLVRTPELLMRWTELNAFTVVLRTHEGLEPAVATQFDASPETLAHMERFAKVYKGLAPYRKTLVAEAAAKGHPVVRHLFLHFPDDRNTHALRYQFLLGPDLMVAPVLDKGADSVEVYFPAASEWVDLWTGADAGKAGTFSKMPAPLSKPAVFLRKGAPAAERIVASLKQLGVIN
jgi:sulfoquinovosidase